MILVTTYVISNIFLNIITNAIITALLIDDWEQFTMEDSLWTSFLKAGAIPVLQVFNLLMNSNPRLYSSVATHIKMASLK